MPKTIDNDLGGTDVTFGFDTAVQVATEAIDRLHTTAESHNRIMVLEVMGRHAGWIAMHSGLAGGADVILIPEQPFDIDEVCALLARRHAPRPPLLDRRRRRGRAAVGGHDGGDRRRRPTSSATRGWAGSARASSRRSSSAPATRRARPCSGTSSAAGRRRRSTACSPRGWAWPRSRRRTTARWGTMASLRSTRIEMVPLADAVAQLRVLTDEDLRIADALLE